MRKINVLNENYEKVGLDTIVYTNKTIDEIAYVDSDGTKYKYSDILDGDYNDVVKNVAFTNTGADVSWTLGKAFYIADSELAGLDVKRTTLNSETVDASIIINGIELRPVSHDYLLASADGENCFSYPSSTGIYVAFSDTSFPTITKEDVGSVATYLQANNVEFVFEKATFLPIAEPSKSQYDIWIETFKSRYQITKETYTLREFMELNEIPNHGIGGEDNSTGPYRTYLMPNGTISKALGNTYNALKLVFSINGNEEFFMKIEVETGDLREALGISFHWSDTTIDEQDLIENEFFDFVATHAGNANLYLIPDGTIINDIILNYIFMFDKVYFDEYMTKEHMDYIVSLYKQVKYEEEDSDKLYFETGKSKFDIAYTNKTIDEVVYEGKTLRDIFEHGSELENPFFDEGENGWIDGTSSTFEVIDGVASITPDVNSQALYQSIVSVVGHTYYYSVEVKSDYINFLVANFSFPAADEFLYYVDVDNWEKLSVISTADIDSSNEIQIRQNSGVTFGTIYAKYVVLIDMAMFIVQPTSAQMDTWRDQFMARKDLEKIKLTYSDIFEKGNLLDMVEDHWSDSGVIHILENKELLVENIVTSVGYITYNDGRIIELYKKYFYSIETKPIVKASDINYISGALDGSTAGTNVSLFNDDILADIFLLNSIIADVADDFIGNLIVKLYILPLASVIGQKVIFKEMFMVDMAIFDERITQNKLDLLLSEFKIIRNSIIKPEVVVITDPIGFGNKAKMLLVDDHVYGHEVEYDLLQFRMNFGINYSAYGGYDLMMNMLKNNKAIIEYDWGIGSRFADVRLVRAPKREKDTLSLLREKWEWKRLNPWYELVELTESFAIENTHPQPLNPAIEFTASATSVSIKLKDGATIEQEIAFSGLTIGDVIIVDCENKTIKYADGTNAYGKIDFTKQSFLSIEEGIEYVVEFIGTSANKINYKQWVIS